MANEVHNEKTGRRKCARPRSGKLTLAAAFVLTAVFGLLAADVDIDWKWDGSGRSVPAAQSVDEPAGILDTLFVTSSESTGGVMYCGLLLLFR